MVGVDHWCHRARSDLVAAGLPSRPALSYPAPRGRPRDHCCARRAQTAWHPVALGYFRSDAFAWQTHRPRHDRHAAGRLPRPRRRRSGRSLVTWSGFAAGTCGHGFTVRGDVAAYPQFLRAVVVLVTGVGVGALSWLATGTVISIAAYLMVWGLLFIAPRAVVDLQRSRRRKRGRSDSDADQLARLTRMPAGLWVGIFWLLTAACLAAGGWLLMTTG